MSPSIPVDLLLSRVPRRARVAYTNLIAHPESRYDEATGWSCANIRQHELASEMQCSLRTTERALADLREIGIVRVLAWPSAYTETQVRVADIRITSIFGPLRAALEAANPYDLVDDAIRYLNWEWERFRKEANM